MIFSLSTLSNMLLYIYAIKQSFSYSSNLTIVQFILTKFLAEKDPREIGIVKSRKLKSLTYGV